MIERVLRQHVTVVRPDTDGTDRYGNPVMDWVENATRTTYPAYVAESRTEEDEDDRETRVDHFLCLLPPDADIEATDRVEFDGDTFEVIGDPITHFRGGTRAHHIKATLRRIAG